MHIDETPVDRLDLLCHSGAGDFLSKPVLNTITHNTLNTILGLLCLGTNKAYIREHFCIIEVSTYVEHILETHF